MSSKIILFQAKINIDIKNGLDYHFEHGNNKKTNQIMVL